MNAVADYVRNLLHERVNLVRWYRQRACERQGIPYEESPVPPMPAPDPPAPTIPDEIKVTVTGAEGAPLVPTPPPTSDPPTSTEPATPAEPTPVHEVRPEVVRPEVVHPEVVTTDREVPKLSWKQLASGGAAALLLTGLGAGAMNYFGGGDGEGKPSTVIESSENTTVNPPTEGSILQWLEDEGEHLP